MTREVRADGLMANVGIGFPKHWNVENGVFTVYDDQGYPWGAPDPGDGGLFKFKIQYLGKQFNLKQGNCQVRHVYDREDFFRRQPPVPRHESQALHV